MDPQCYVKSFFTIANLILVPWCNESKCEDDIKERSRKRELAEGEMEDDRAPSMGAKSLCIPFEQPSEGVEGLELVGRCLEGLKSATRKQWLHAEGYCEGDEAARLMESVEHGADVCQMCWRRVRE